MHAPNPAQAAPFAYITNFEGRSISVIDVATNSVVMTIDEVAPRKPGCVAISPDGSTVYVVTTYNDFGAVDVFDAATNTCTDILDVGFRPNDVAVSPDGSRLYATGFYSSSVAVVDTATGGVIERVSVGKGHFGIAVHPDGARVYAADGDSGVVSVFDTSTNTEIADIDVDGGATNDVVVHPDGTRA
jgi:YVTN family beta-propeller protein